MGNEDLSSPKKKSERLAEILKELKLKPGWANEQFHVAKILLHSEEMTEGFCLRMRHVFGVNPEWLLHGKEPKFLKPPEQRRVGQEKEGEEKELFLIVEAPDRSYRVKVTGDIHFRLVWEPKASGNPTPPERTGGTDSGASDPLV